MSGQEDALLVIRPRAGQAPRMEQALAGALAGRRCETVETAEALRDGMRRIADPHQLTLGILAPGQVAGRAHQAAERLGMMAGMKENRAHALQHGLLHPIHHFVGHFLMRHVAPPDQYVGLIQHLLAQAVGQIVQRDRADADLVAFQSFFQRTVDSFGIDGTNRVGRFFMKTFIVYRYTNQGLHLLCF